ncbi:MAG TPA: PTS sugar transporter subunit IIC [Smithellaceae bacterium]|nr:PTS sugar transporter subunit IIC [Smithellaceae bacterium]
MLSTIIALSVLGGVLCLDRIVIQAMVSRPIVLAPLMGWLIGIPLAGLIIGAMLELFWIDRIPIGIYIPPNDSASAVLAVSIAGLAGPKTGAIVPEIIALALLLAIPCGLLIRLFDVKIIESNNRLSDEALEDAKLGHLRAIEKKTYLALGKAAIVYVGALFLFQVLIVYPVAALYPGLPDALIQTLKLTYYFMPLLGIATAIAAIKMRGAIPLFCAVFLILAIAWELFHVL